MKQHLYFNRRKKGIPRPQHQNPIDIAKKAKFEKQLILESYVGRRKGNWVDPILSQIQSHEPLSLVCSQ